jgi:hypothetical protein
MAHLTEDQKRYLAQQGIPLSVVSDGSGLSRREYHCKLKNEGKYFAYGVTRCTNGHTLRTRAGQCIQCFPASIAFIKRHFAAAYLYIAGSRSERLIKIGSSKNPNNRIYIANLNGHEYAGVSDWQVLYSIYVEQAAKIEIEIHGRLREYQTRVQFVRNGDEQVAKECFTCNYSIARKTIVHMLKCFKIHKEPEWEEKQDILDQYEFIKV